MYGMIQNDAKSRPLARTDEGRHECDDRIHDPGYYREYFNFQNVRVSQK